MTEQALHVDRGVDLDVIEHLGPIDYLIIEYPHGRVSGQGLPLLLDLVDRGIIRVIDLLFVEKSADGTVSGLEIKDMDVEGAADFDIFAGASTGLLTPDDVEEAGAALEPGTAGAVIVYENLWAAPLAVALRKSGAQFVAGGRIPVQALIAALDEAERRDAEAGTQDDATVSVETPAQGEE